MENSPRRNVMTSPKICFLKNNLPGLTVDTAFLPSERGNPDVEDEAEDDGRQMGKVGSW